MKISIMLGTRPQIVKSIPLIHGLNNSSNVDLKIIHTGQHYDYKMSKVFFEEFSIPDPYCNLNVGSGSHAYQTAKIIQELEGVLLRLKPDIVLVPGDTNSALASALTSVKLGIPIAHVESGARSYDMTMAEEINRRIIDHISTALFAVSSNCASNLKKESVLGRIIYSGDTMYDVYLYESKMIQKSEISDKIGFDKYCVLTLHRAENVDDVKKLKKTLKSILSSIDRKIIFPIHPRTKNILEKTIAEYNNLVTIDPLPYHDMMKLLQGSSFVLTDSGGLQKEAFWCKTPCITLRDRTEWIETVKLGVNFTAGNEREISSKIQMLLKNLDSVKSKFRNIKNPYGDGNASKKIIKYLLDLN